MSSFTFGEVVEVAEKVGKPEDLDAGIYDVEVLKINNAVKKSDASVKLVFIEVKVTEGMDKGKRASITYSSKGLGFKFLNKDLNTLGITNDVMKESTAEDLTNELAGVNAKLEVKQNGNYVNYEFLSVESQPASAGSSDSGSGLPWS